MNLQTFTADSMAAALTLVKAKLGGNAVILHTRTYRRGGVLGFGARQVVEVTAGSGPKIDQARQRQAGDPRATPAPRGRTSGGGSRPAPQRQQAAGDLIRRTYAVAQAELKRRQDALPLPADVLSQPATVGALIQDAGASVPRRDTASSSQVAAMPHQQLSCELAEVKRMVARVMTRQSKPAAADLPDALFDQYRALLEQEVAEELADQTIAAVRGRLSPAALEDPQVVRQAVREELIRLIPIAGHEISIAAPSDGRPRTIALIGPTGVGKTTTVAKLAAQFKLRQKKRVGLVTLDTYRIAAVEQLRTYAQIIGLPLKVAADPEALRKVLTSLSDCDVVLIDTAGRSQRDDGRLRQLQELLDAANPHEVHLVLSSTCSQAVIAEAVDRFAKIRTDRIILTKLDEAVSFGVVLNVARQVDKQFSYVTTGQEVPHDIEASQADRLVDLLLGEGLKPC